MGRKGEDLERLINKIKDELMEEITNLSDKITMQNSKMRIMRRRIDELEEKLLDKEERENINKEKAAEYEKDRSRNESKNKEQEGSYEREKMNKDKKDEVKDVEIKKGFCDEYIEQIWKFDIGIRRRMIIVSKGIRVYEAKQEILEWLVNIIGVSNKKKIKVVRYMENAVWFICDDKEIKDLVMEKRIEIKGQGWYKVDEVLTRKEKEERFKLYEFAKKWMAADEEIKITDNILYIEGRKYKWDQEQEKIVKLNN